jgi:hypothetical protein
MSDEGMGHVPSVYTARRRHSTPSRTRSPTAARRTWPSAEATAVAAVRVGNGYHPCPMHLFERNPSSVLLRVGGIPCPILARKDSGGEDGIGSGS